MVRNFIKRQTPTQVFSCDFYKMLEKSFFYGTPMVAAFENSWRISKNFWRQPYTERFMWFDQCEHVNDKIMVAFCIKICMIRFLKDRMRSTYSDLYKEILKPNKSHTNCTIQIVLCKTSLIQLEKDLYRRIYKGKRL